MPGATPPSQTRIIVPSLKKTRQRVAPVFCRVPRILSPRGIHEPRELRSPLSLYDFKRNTFNIVVSIPFCSFEDGIESPGKCFIALASLSKCRCS